MRDATPPPKKKKEELDPILTRTGGAYIPPARLRLMQQSITDKSSVAYQRLSWEALKKSINGLINKVNVANIGNIVQELFQENIVRGRGVLARSLVQAQAASPTFTHVYAALVSIINTKFPQTGELIAKRLLLQFQKGFRRNDKNICMTAVKFLAHLVNQQVLHELVALELLTLLLEEPSDDSVEVSVGFLKESGQKLTEVSPRGVHAVFETLRSILHSGKITPRIQYMIEVLFAIRKDNFKEHPAVVPELDLVQEADQITHLLSLGDEFNSEDILNVFQADPDFAANEEKYKAIKAEILGEESSSGSSEAESGEEEEESEEEDEEQQQLDMMDMTDAKVTTLRRTIYLTIMSSLDYEECAHKMLKSMEEGQEREIANMVIECCSQERSYLRFYGLLGQRFCQLNQAWVEQFDDAFQQQYATVHRLETNKLRNVAKFFGQLFYADALPWTGMSCIHLNEEETNSSSRIFVKILFQELAEFMGLSKLNERLKDPLLAMAFEGVLPRDNPKNTRFAINFFTSIGLGGLTDDLREHLKNTQKLIMAQKQVVSSSDTDSSDSDSDSSDSSSDAESSSESSSSEDEKPRHQKRKRGKETGREDRKEKDSRKHERSRESGHRSKKRQAQ